MKKTLNCFSTLWCFLFWSNVLRFSDSICGFAHASNDCLDTNLPFCLPRFAVRLRSSLRVSLQLSLVMSCLCNPPSNKFLMVQHWYGFSLTPSALDIIRVAIHPPSLSYCRSGLHIVGDESFHYCWWHSIPSGYARRAWWHCIVQELPEVRSSCEY